jgi:predicted transcriptional regulator
LLRAFTGAAAVEYLKATGSHQSHTDSPSHLNPRIEILRVVHAGETVNRIVHRVAVPWKRGKETVNNLVANGYLAKERVLAARYVYKITDEGVKAMKTYDGIIENLSNNQLDIRER